MPVRAKTSSHRRPRAAFPQDGTDDYAVLQCRRSARKEYINKAPEFSVGLANLTEADLLRVGATYYAAKTEEQLHLNHPRTPKSHRTLVLLMVQEYQRKAQQAAERWMECKGLCRASPLRLERLAKELRQEADRLRALREQLGPNDASEFDALTEPRLQEVEFQRFALR